MTGHLRGDARKKADDAHQIHPDPAVRALIERERRAAAVAALREAAAQLHEAPILRREELTLSRWLRDRADRLAAQGEA